MHSPDANTARGDIIDTTVNGTDSILDAVWKDVQFDSTTEESLPARANDSEQAFTTRYNDGTTGNTNTISNERMPKKIVQYWWVIYRSFARKHQVKLELCDEAMTRILFWAPHSSPPRKHSASLANNCREVLYGLLSLNRMAMDLAHQRNIENSYGATIRQEAAEPTPFLPPTAIRIALTVTHGLMPMFLELCQSSNTHDTERRRTRFRHFIERIKFVFRMVLVVSYWKELIGEDRKNPNEHNAPITGLIRDSGMYRGREYSIIPTIGDECARLERHNYVGRRTGRRLGHSDHNPSGTNSTQQKVKTVMGELLHIYRPLYWACAERRQAQGYTSSGNTLWLSWAVALGMDLTSLQLLSSSTSRPNGNHLSREELKRRRLKLFLYLLRAPMWDRLTHPNVQRLVTLVQRVPFVGKLIETYLWDVILYWKHPFFLEE